MPYFDWATENNSKNLALSCTNVEKNTERINVRIPSFPTQFGFETLFPHFFLSSKRNSIACCQLRLVLAYAIPLQKAASSSKENDLISQEKRK